jgi:uncharacterized membrane protein
VFTRAVALAFRLFGDSLVSARLPALAAGVVLVLVTCIWVGRKAGLLAGATAAMLLAIVPGTLEVAVFARFYTLHALVIALIYIALFEAARPGRATRARTAWIVLALALLPLGWHLQENTIVALGAGIAGVVAVLMFDHWSRVGPVIRRHPILIVCALALLAAVSFAVA